MTSRSIYRLHTDGQMDGHANKTRSLPVSLRSLGRYKHLFYGCYTHYCYNTAYIRCNINDKYYLGKQTIIHSTSCTSSTNHPTIYIQQLISVNLEKWQTKTTSLQDNRLLSTGNAPSLHQPHTRVSLNTAPAAPWLLRPLVQCCRGSKTAPSTAPVDEAKHWGCNTHKNVISTCNLHFVHFMFF